MRIIVSPIANAETQNVMAHLPVDIVYYNILTKLPVKSLLRFKSVSKDWYNLINSSNFINIHRQHTLKYYDYCDFLVVCSRKCTRPFTNISYIYFDAPNYTSEKCMELESFDNSYCRIIGSSNGLICFKFVGTGFLLCNPVTREYSRLIESPSLTSVDLWSAYYGFGYDEVSHDYKIVNMEFRKTTSEQVCIGHLYSTNNSLWKEVPKNPNSIKSYGYCEMSVVVNNRLHWIILKINNGITEIKSILTFDLHTEEFREISYSTSLKTHDGRLGLMVSRGRLCTLATNLRESNHRNISMWVMKEYGLVESWTKLYDIEGEHIPLDPFRIITQLSRRDGEEQVLLLTYDDHHRQELVLYNLKNKSITGKVNDPASQLYYANQERWVCIASPAPIPGNDPNNRPTDLATVEDIKKEVALAYSAYMSD